MRNSITVADRSFNPGPFMLQHLHRAAPGIDRQAHVPEARHAFHDISFAYLFMQTVSCFLQNRFVFRTSITSYYFYK